MEIRLHDRETIRVDALYSAMGMCPHSDLAAALGADLADDGRIRTDDHQRTSGRRAGVLGGGRTSSRAWNQLGVAMAHGEIAADRTRNNRLRREEGLSLA